MLSCDWGTSSFRLRLVDNQTGTVLQAITSRQGVKTISSAASGKPFRNYLATQIAKIEGRSAQPLAFVPVVISGMASSSIGWKELPYGSLPFLLDGSQLPIKQIPKAEEFPHDILLVSGICSSSDVMRGEETQMIGLAATHNLENAVCILPGTHSKHIFINQRTIRRFRTYMTGELFGLLSTQSILNESVSPPKENFYKESFSMGVKRALKSDVWGHLFSIRAKDLLGRSTPEENYDFLSGLLIGSELKGLLPYNRGRPLYFGGEDYLRGRYVTALEMMGITVQPPDDGPPLTAQGHRVLLNRFNPNDGNT